MKLSRILPIGIIMVALTACSGSNISSVFSKGFSSDPNSPMTTKSIKLENISSLATMSGLTVNYIPGKGDKIVVQAPADLMDKIEVTQQKGLLSVGLTEGVRSGLDRVKITVETPEIVDFSASSGSDLNIADGYAPAGGEISLSCSSGADIEGKQIKAESIGLSVSSGADIEVDVIGGAVVGSSSSGASLEISGTAKTVELSASSGGSVYAKSLKSETGSATASSGGPVKSNIARPSQLKESSGGSVSNSNAQ